MICRGTQGACSRTSSLLLRSLITNSVLFDCYPFWDLSDLLTKTALSPLIKGRGENLPLAANVRKKNSLQPRKPLLYAAESIQKAQQPLADMENQGLRSPPAAGIPSSWKTSSSAFLGHRSTSRSPCRISFWHPTKQSKRRDAAPQGTVPARRGSMGPPPHGTPGWELPTLRSAHPASRGLGTGKRQEFGARRGPTGWQGSQGGDPSARALLASIPGQRLTPGVIGRTPRLGWLWEADVSPALALGKARARQGSWGYFKFVLKSDSSPAATPRAGRL